jgi:hypothetical protein
MQKVFALTAFLTFGSAISSSTGPTNLIPIKSLCFDDQDILPPIDKSLLPKDAVQDIFQFVDTKLTAYRIPHINCGNSIDHELHITIDTLDNVKDSIIFMLSVNIYANVSPNYLKPVAVYSINSFGKSSTSPSSFLDYTKDVISDAIDRLAADFAKAHP